MNWIIFLSQLPTNPSSLRVTVWRKMRSVGALGLQNGIWLLPDGSEQKKFVKDLGKLIQSNQAQFQIFTVMPLEEQFETEILERFRSERDEEYVEVMERASNFISEIKKETASQKFTYAELEENEQNLQYLCNWIEKIHKRDFFSALIGKQAEEIVEECQRAFDIFAAEIYRRHTEGAHLEQQSNDNLPPNYQE